MLVISFIISMVINLLTKFPYHTIPGDSPIRTAQNCPTSLVGQFAF